MASGLPAAASCPVCRDFFRDPVSIHCGHNFCRACIARRWEWATRRFACPRCREEAPAPELRPNRELAKVVEAARRLARGWGEEEEEEKKEKKKKEKKEKKMKKEKEKKKEGEEDEEEEKKEKMEMKEEEEKKKKKEEQDEEEKEKIKMKKEKEEEEEEEKQKEKKEEDEDEEEKKEKKKEEKEEEEEEKKGKKEKKEKKKEEDEDEKEKKEKKKEEDEEMDEEDDEEEEEDEKKEKKKENEKKEEEEEEEMDDEEEEEEGEEGCRTHREPLRFLCEQDGALLCAVCREGRAHRGHRAAPAGEALERLQSRLQSRLHALRRGRASLVASRQAQTRRNLQLLEEAEAERRRLLASFEGLRLSLEDVARDLLGRAGDLEREVEEAQEEAATLLTQEISRLEASVEEAEAQERRLKRPPGRFLQEVRSILSRLDEEHLQEPPSLLPHLEEKMRRFRQKTDALELVSRSFRDALRFELPEKVKLTLDPSTAHPQLAVSPDGLSVRWEAAPSGAILADDPCVLASEAIASGRCCWDVEVAPEGSWALGVAKETTKPTEDAAAAMELWSMGRCQGQFWVLTSFERVRLDREETPRRIRVVLDHRQGEVAFYDAEEKTLLFVFSSAPFEGRRVRPWFLVWGEGARLTLKP